MFSAYVQTRLAPLRVVAERTEWEIYGEDEDIAGSIDFVGRFAGGENDGKLCIVDWKRTRDLRNRDRHKMGLYMKPPLDFIPDGGKWHYALQLNCYAYLIEKYYGEHVAMMEVACFHPDNDGA